MALWNSLENLPNRYQGELQQIYVDFQFPVELRRIFAVWIEKHERKLNADYSTSAKQLLKIFLQMIMDYRLAGPEQAQFTRARNSFREELFKKLSLVGVVSFGTLAAIPLTISAVGFTSAGVASGSIAAAAQSYFYVGNTGGAFSLLQSAGTSVALKAAGIVGAANSIALQFFGNRSPPPDDPPPPEQNDENDIPRPPPQPKVE